MSAPISPRPLLITADEDLLDDVLRIATAAGIDLDVVPDAGAAMSVWLTAPCVLVGHDVVSTVGDRFLARRPHVVVVCGALEGEVSEITAATWRRTVDIGAEHLVELPDGTQWLVGFLAESTSGPVAGGPVISVVPGRGGAGASTLSVLLARAFGGESLLVDADALGGGLDVRLDAESLPGPRWSDLEDTRGRLSPGPLLQALPRVDGVSVLSAASIDPRPISVESLLSVVDAGARGAPLTVIDCARTLDGIMPAACARSDLVIVCVPADLYGVVASRSIVSMIRRVSSRVVGVLRADRTSDLRAEDIGDAMGIPLLPSLPTDRSLVRGESPLAISLSPHRRTLDAALAQVGLGRAGLSTGPQDKPRRRIA